MENGVSGGDVRRACRNDNEDNALGERATGRTSSGAKRGEPITFGGESTALKWQKSLIGATFPYHNRTILPHSPAAMHTRNEELGVVIYRAPLS